LRETDSIVVTGDVPVCPRRPLVHVSHGVPRADDYAWLRDTTDPEALAYLRAERDYYDRATGHLAGLRTELADELTARSPRDEQSVRWREAGIDWSVQLRDGEEHERLLRVDPRDGSEVVALDVNGLVADAGGYADVGLRVPSPDGRLLAYAVDVTGDEVFELRFRDLRTGRDLPDVVGRCYYGGAWSADSGTFFYTVHDAVYRSDRVLRHRIGEDPSRDVVVAREPDQRYELQVHGSRDGAWVVITAVCRDTTEVLLVSADQPDERPRLVAPRRRGVEYRVEPLPGGWSGAGDDSRLLLVTNDGRAEFDLRTAPVPPSGGVGDPASWSPVPAVSLADGERLEFAEVLERHVVLGVRRACEPVLRLVPRATEGETAAFVEVTSTVPYGQVRLWRAHDWAATSITVVEENLVTPRTWRSVDLATGATQVLRSTPVPGADPGRYVTERLWATAPDGTQVPVTTARRRDVGPGQSVGALLYGYGAYEACSWPQFEVGTLSLLDRGLVVAIAHVRGGGERGRAWWTDGRLRRKQNSFDDFVAARDALVAARWAAEGGVVSRGLSAGGLLQGAVFSQAPDRWRAVVAEVRFVDVVTTMSDPTIPLTVNEWDEWGDPSDPDDLAAMLAYSPYDNPPPPQRPALLVTGALHDPRVLVHEPSKWVARLRATDDVAHPSPLLFRIELGEGAHTGPSGRFAHLAYEAEVLAWVLDVLGVARRLP
jgi:oligopeptidase B